MGGGACSRREKKKVLYEEKIEDVYGEQSLSVYS